MKNQLSVGVLKDRTQQRPVKNFNIKSLPKYNYNSEMIRANSVILNNKLTKPSYSHHDSSLHTSNQTMKNAVRALMHKNKQQTTNSNSKYLRRYYSDHQNHQPAYNNVTQILVPKLSLKRYHQNQQGKQAQSMFVDKRAKSQHANKFKLLFKDQQPRRKTASQRKIDRLDWKISALQEHRKYLQSLKPKPIQKVIQQKVKPRGTIVEPHKIKKLAQNIRDNLELYFNMYSQPKKVGDLLKSVEGYTKIVHKILFQNKLCAKRIRKDEEITQNFWIFKDPSSRPQFYGEQDLNLFNTMQNFSMKMDKNFNQTRKNYVQFESIKTEKTKLEIAKKLNIYEKNRQPNREIIQINKFIENRKRHNQERRQASLSKLQQLGVRFNVEQRSKDLIVREKQKIMGRYVIQKERK